MKTKFSISNFRAFDDNGLCVEIRPITILTGCNSSGKSSLVKSLMLLSNFIKAEKTISEGEVPKLDFSKKPLSLLGNFESVLNNSSNKNGNKTMTFRYNVKSLLIGQELYVTYVFGLDAFDLKKNGFLQRVDISSADGKVLMSGLNSRVIDNILHPDHEQYKDFFGLPDKGMIGTNLSDYKKYFFAFALSILSLCDAHKDYLDNIIEGENHNQIYSQLKESLDEIKDMFSKETVFSSIEYYSDNIKEANQMFHCDKGALKQSAMANIITYLPVLKTLDDFSKDCFAEKFRLLCNGLVERSVISPKRIESIIDAYTSSQYVLFSDFYRSLEDSFLDTRFVAKAFSNIDNFAHDATSIHGLEGKLEIEEVIEDDTINLERVLPLLCALEPNAPGIITSEDKWTFETLYNHEVLEAFERYRDALLKDILSCDICEQLSYVGSSRIDVQRLYSIDSHDNFGNTISEYFEAIRNHRGKHDYCPGSFINKWIREFHIGERFEIESLANGVGVILKIYEDQDDREGKLVADFGYGISQLISILIEIETAILNSEVVMKSHAIDHIKKTVQLSKLFEYSPRVEYKPRTIAIEEPEIHLHPDFQALLANMFYEAFSVYNINFIIETHSEYLVRRSQLLYTEAIALGNENPFSIYYFPNKGNDSPYEMIFSPSGHFENNFGEGFYDAAASDALKLSRKAKELLRDGK